MPQDPSIAAAKADLRTRFRALLEARDDRPAASDTIADRVLQRLEVAAAGNVFTCLSFGTEVDTWPLVDRLIALGKTVWVPRAAKDATELTVHRYPCDLETLSFGLKQPVAGTPALPPGAIDTAFDVAIVSGLAYDEHGYRLGYGRGYFDRFLAGRQLTSIGLAFDIQVVDSLPRSDHDMPVSIVLTESRTIRSRQ